jgi:hypothetical protein
MCNIWRGGDDIHVFVKLLAIMFVVSTRDNATALYPHMFGHREEVGSVMFIRAKQIP